MLGDLVQEAVQGLPPGLDEVVVESLHHALHHKLLWQWLNTHSAVCAYSTKKKMFFVLFLTWLSLTLMMSVGWFSSSLLRSHRKSW